MTITQPLRLTGSEKQKPTNELCRSESGRTRGPICLELTDPLRLAGTAKRKTGEVCPGKAGSRLQTRDRRSIVFPITRMLRPEERNRTARRRTSAAPGCSLMVTQTPRPAGVGIPGGIRTPASGLRDQRTWPLFDRDRMSCGSTGRIRTSAFPVNSRAHCRYATVEEREKAGEWWASIRALARRPPLPAEPVVGAQSASRGDAELAGRHTVARAQLP